MRSSVVTQFPSAPMIVGISSSSIGSTSAIETSFSTCSGILASKVSCSRVIGSLDAGADCQRRRIRRMVSPKKLSWTRPPPFLSNRNFSALPRLPSPTPIQMSYPSIFFFYTSNSNCHPKFLPTNSRETPSYKLHNVFITARSPQHIPQPRHKRNQNLALPQPRRRRPRTLPALLILGQLREEWRSKEGGWRSCVAGKQEPDYRGRFRNRVFRSYVACFGEARGVESED